MKRNSLILNLFILVISLSACSNEFESEANSWVYVTTTREGVKAFIDANRLECLDNMCKAWTKLEFPEVKKLSEDKFHDSDNPHINLASKRIDSMRYYYCFSNRSMMTSYQMYDDKGKLINTKWINQPEMELVKKNTLEYDLFQHACKPLLEEENEETE